jgi:hypothetical protein
MRDEGEGGNMGASPAAFGGEVKVDLRKGLNGREHWRAWWWDPRIGSREVFIRDSSAPTHMFTAPTDQDWLLFIEAL